MILAHGNDKKGDIILQYDNKELKKTSDTKEEKIKAALFGTVVRCGYLRVRSDASITSEELTTIKAGTTVEIMSRSVIRNADYNFCKVRLENSITGYCVVDYIELNAEL